MLAAVVTVCVCSVNAAHAATIVVLGDSISAAYGIPRERGWVQLLAERAASDGHTVVNASLSGETTGGGLARLPDLLVRHRPDIVVIELGGNDGLRGYPIARIRANLQQLVQKSAATGARVVVLGMQIPPNYGERYVSGFHAAFAAAASDGVGLVPFLLEGVALMPDLMQADGIHPTAAAQPRLLENAWPAISAALEAAGPAANQRGQARSQVPPALP